MMSSFPPAVRSAGTLPLVPQTEIKLLHSGLSSNTWLPSLPSTSAATLLTSVRPISLGPLTFAIALASRRPRSQGTSPFSFSSSHEIIGATTSTISAGGSEVAPILCLISGMCIDGVLLPVRKCPAWKINYKSILPLLYLPPISTQFPKTSAVPSEIHCSSQQVLHIYSHPPLLFPSFSCWNGNRILSWGLCFSTVLLQKNHPTHTAFILVDLKKTCL